MNLEEPYFIEKADMSQNNIRHIQELFLRHKDLPNMTGYEFARLQVHYEDNLMVVWYEHSEKEPIYRNFTLLLN